MRVLRCTLYPPPGIGAPVTTVTRETDLNCSVEEAEQSMRNHAEMLVWTEIFAVPNETSIESSTFEAHRRMEEAQETERNLIVLYYWSAMQLDRLRDGGTLMMPKPAPLKADAMKRVFEQLSQHRFYKRNTFLAFDEDGTPVCYPEKKL